jgi:hypothetical protein
MHSPSTPQWELENAVKFYGLPYFLVKRLSYEIAHKIDKVLSSIVNMTAFT